MAKAKPASTISPAAQREHDAVMADIADLERTIIQTLVGEYVIPRAPRDSKRELMAALAEAFPEGQYPTVKEIEAALADVYRRKGWGEVPKRDAINRAIGRRKRR